MGYAAVAPSSRGQFCVNLNLRFTTQWCQLIIEFIGSPGPGINIFTHTDAGIKLFI